MTPEHIRQIAIAVKKLAPDVARVAARARAISDERPAPVEVIAEGVPAVPKAERSSFAKPSRRDASSRSCSSRLRRASSVT